MFLICTAKTRLQGETVVGKLPPRHLNNRTVRAGALSVQGRVSSAGGEGKRLHTRIRSNAHASANMHTHTSTHPGLAYCQLAGTVKINHVDRSLDVEWM
jgi:hypothetical protein